MLEQNFTTKEVAHALGVGVSTIKRWVDRGMLQGTRTPGGHRRILLSELRQLADSGQFPEVDWTRLFETSRPDICVPSGSLVANLVAALRAGYQHLTTSLIRSAHEGGMPLEVLADEVIGPTMTLLGHQWHEGTIDVYQEHRSTQLCLSALQDLRSRIETPLPANAPIALGGCPEGDHYLLATLLVSMVLREHGWNTINIGPNLPLTSLSRAINQYQPKLVWLSISHLAQPDQFLNEYRAFYHIAADNGICVAIGGNALTEDLRRQLLYTFHGDSMAQLVAYARSLHPYPQRPRRGRPPRDLA